MSESVLQVDHVSKKFCRQLGRSMLYAAADVARDAVGFVGHPERLRPDEFWSLHDVSFDVRHGESVALIGAGKTTLLRLLAGIFRPDRGRIRRSGRVVTLLGLGRAEIDRRFDAIARFSGLDSSVLDAPVKTYSSGMSTRLAFAVATHVDAELLLMDEVLALADAEFVNKCHHHLRTLRQRGTALMIASHNAAAQRESCDRAILLEKGCVSRSGEVQKVFEFYQSRSVGP